MKRILTSVILAALLAVPSMSVSAQDGIGIWGNVGLEKKLAKGLDVELEAQYRQSASDMSKTDRWSAGIGLSKRLYRNSLKTFTVKADAGYKFMRVFNTYSTKSKTDGVESGQEPQYYVNNLYNFNLTDAFVESRHRLYASLQASYIAGQFKFSVREGFQFTHSDSIQVSRDKWRYKSGTYEVKTDSVWKSGDNKKVLRSRIAMSYNIPDSKFEPFVSYELFTRLDNGMGINKTRLSVGAEYSFDKRHDFKLAYIYQNKADDNESSGSIISLGYTFQF